MIRRVCRVDPVDELRRDEGVLLLYERNLVRLSVLGDEIYRVSEQPRTVAELALHLAEVFGQADVDTEAATEAAVTQLLAEGVLRELP